MIIQNPSSCYSLLKYPTKMILRKCLSNVALHSKVMPIFPSTTFFHFKKNQSLPTVFNVHSPCMYFVRSKEENKQTGEFENTKLQYICQKKDLGKDVKTLSDFNRKLGRSNHMDNAVGSYARG